MKALLSKLLVCATIALPVATFANTIDFDANPAPPFFVDKSAEDIVTTLAVTIQGGVILNQSSWANGATSSPNVYATTNILVSFLPAIIGGVFSAPVNSLQLDVLNGLFNTPSTFTLTGFSSNGSVVDMISLTGFGQPGFVGGLSISGSGITSFSVTSDQAPGIDFAIDTVTFSAVPEASNTLGLMAMALVGLAMLRCKRTHQSRSVVGGSGARRGDLITDLP
jgi:hypothetical protein